MVTAPRALGRHLLCEYHGCDRARIDDVEVVRTALRDAVAAAGVTPLHEHLHAFSPHGVTGVVVIAESHFSIHTWPEHQYVAVDLFTCGERADPWPAFAQLGLAFAAASHAVVELRRGVLDDRGQLVGPGALVWRDHASPA